MKFLLLVAFTLVVAGCPIPNPDGNPSDSTQSDTSLFATSDSLSPHLSFISRSYTDFCYCWNLPSDSGDIARKNAARKFDLVMSGDGATWKKYNSDMKWLRYNLVISTLDEGNKDPNSLTGKWQQDFREWAAANNISQTDYEKAWLHSKGTAIDSASRLHPFIWTTNRFFGNPRDSIFTEYTRSRLLRGLDGWSDGYFLDEMDHNNLKYFSQSAEFADLDSTQTHAVFTNWLSGLQQWIDDSTGIKPIFQTNAAGYSKGQWDKAIGIATGSMHLEVMNLSTQEQASVWTLIDELLANNTYVDFVAAETWQDMLNPKWLIKYPGGNYDLPVYRSQVSHLASYYMVVPAPDSTRNPWRLMDIIALQADNNRNIVTPDSTDLKIYYLNVGHPTESRMVVVDTLDALQQKAKVWKRDFTHSRILYRAVNSWRDTVFTDTTAIQLPDSLTANYSLVKANGDITPLDYGLRLRNGEAAILIPDSLK